MTRASAIAIGTILVACVATCPRGARAQSAVCSPPPPSVTIQLPAEGQTDWARNAGAIIRSSLKVNVSLTGPRPLPASELVELAPASDLAGGGGARWLHLLEPAAPGASYTLRAESTDASGHTLSATRVWRTSGDVDSAPPVFTGLAEMAIAHEPMAGGGDCRPGPGFYAELGFPAPSETAIVHIHEAAQTGKLLGARAAVITPPEAREGGATLYLGDEDDKVWCFVGRAVDLAGNEALPRQICCATTAAGKTVHGACRALGTMPDDGGPPLVEPHDGPATDGGGGQGGAGIDAGTGLADRGGCGCRSAGAVTGGPSLAHRARIAWLAFACLSLVGLTAGRRRGRRG